MKWSLCPVDKLFLILIRVFSLQVSLRDPLRCGADDNELSEIIGAAVCRNFFFLIMYNENTIHVEITV